MYPGFGSLLGWSEKMTPGQLESGLLSIFGNRLVGLYLPEDIVLDGYGHVDTWAGRIGYDLTAHSADTTYFYKDLDGLNGRVGLLPSSGVVSPLYISGNTDVAYEYCIAVANISALPFDQYRTIIRTVNPKTIVLEANQGQSYLRTSSWNKYIDGYFTSDCTTGIHIFAGNYISNTATGITVAGNTDGSYTWDSLFGAVVIVSKLDSIDKHNQATELLKRYYSID
jgi:hypothetical protein